MKNEDEIAALKNYIVALEKQIDQLKFDVSEWKNQVLSAKMHNPYYETLSFNLSVQPFYYCHIEQREKLIQHCVADAMHKLLDAASGIKVLYPTRK